MSMKDLMASLETLGGAIRNDAKEPEVTYYQTHRPVPVRPAEPPQESIHILTGRYPCQVRQYSDQMSCSACGLTWDTNETDPPPCPRA